MAEITLTDQNFKEEVLNSSEPVLVDFWATWCGPCKMLGSVIEQIANEYDGKIKVGKVNVDDEQMLARQYNISSIPAVMLFKNGAVVETSIGYKPKPVFDELLKKYI